MTTMTTTALTVYPAIDCLPREVRCVVFQTVLADFDLMKIIMDFYEFHSNNTLPQLVLLWQHLNVTRLVLGDLPGECANYNLSYATSDATRLIVLDLFYDHGFCSFIDRLPRPLYDTSSIPSSSPSPPQIWSTTSNMTN